VTLLHSVSVVFDLLVKVLTPQETATLAVKMIESLPARDPPPQLIQAKLVLVRDIVSSRLFKTNGRCRTLCAGKCGKVGTWKLIEFVDDIFRRSSYSSPDQHL
jgi:hypothetical protein